MNRRSFLKLASLFTVAVPFVKPEFKAPIENTTTTPINIGAGGSGGAGVYEIRTNDCFNHGDLVYFDNGEFLRGPPNHPNCRCVAIALEDSDSTGLVPMRFV